VDLTAKLVWLLDPRVLREIGEGARTTRTLPSANGRAVTPNTP